MILYQRCVLSFFIIALVVWLGNSNALASDHIDGSITTQHAIADISDLYAFPSPEKKDHLIVAMDISPFASRDAHFSERMQYNIILRRLSPQGKGLTTAFNSDNDSDRRISCSFITPEDKAHSITCRVNNKTHNLIVTNKVDSTTANISEPVSTMLNIFAGRRADPFFVNVDWLLSAGREGKLLPPVDDEDSFKRMNVLSMVLSIDMAQLYPKQALGLFAISAESLTQDNPKAPWRRLDRKGRAEITNVTLAPKGGTITNQYNAEETFKLKPENRKNYQQTMLKNIQYYDALDAKKDWNEDAANALVKVLVDDFLVLDMAKPCDIGKEYLAIETALLAGNTHQSCGGRHFNDDIIDRIFSLYVNADKGDAIRDGVDSPFPKPSTRFPYLSAPDDGIMAAFKAFIVRLMIKIKGEL